MKSINEIFTMPNKSFRIKSTSFEFDRKTVCFPPHCHDKLEIIYVMSGVLEVVIQNRTITASQGDILVVNSLQVHSARTGAQPVTYNCLILDYEFFKSRTNDLCDVNYFIPASTGNLVFYNKISDNPAMGQLLSQSIDEFENKQLGYEMYIKGYLFQFIAELIRHFTETVTSGYNNSSIIKCMSYIDEHYPEKLTSSGLAAMAGYSLPCFCRKFKQVCGMAPIDYINLVRCIHADEQLKTGRFSVTEVSVMAGFSNSNYFTRVFKQKLGRLPKHSIPKEKKEKPEL